MKLNQKKQKLMSALACASLSVSSYAVDLGSFNDTELSIKGWMKLNAVFSTYSDGTLAPQNLGRDIYVPSLTPVGGEDEGTQVDFHARTSRIGFGTKTDLDGDTLKTYVELDFAISAGGNERISNSYGARIRHAFLTYNNWLFGQTWTTFMDVGNLPETVDFIGNTDAVILVRQALVRYSRGGFHASIENPESTITPNGGSLQNGTSRLVTDDNSIPDFVMRYDFKRDNFNLSLAGIVRELAIKEGTAVDESTTGGGLSLTGMIKLGRDDFKFNVSAGSGLGRYIGLNIANGAVIDNNGALEAINTTAVYAAYRHWWNTKWRSTVSYSAIEIDNDVALTGTGVSALSSSARLNLMYSPKPKLTFGGEITTAERETEAELTGSMLRLQFMAKLAF